MATNKFDKPKEDNLEKITDHWSVPMVDLVKPSPLKNNRYQNPLNYEKLRAIVNDHAEKLDDCEGIMELLPDLYLVRETLVSSILSPKDLKEVNLNITLHSEAPAEIAEMIREHFTTVFNLNSMMANILGDALFSKGSYILLPIPPTAISTLIQQNTAGLKEAASSLEDLKTFFGKKKLTDIVLPSTGILHKPNSGHYGVEEFNSKVHEDIDSKKLVEISDNILYLMLPTIKEQTSKIRVAETLKAAYGLEGINYSTQVQNIYINRTVKESPFITIPNVDNKKAKLNPVVLTLPPEAVIPVHVPGDPSDHVGYFIFLDEEGNPLHYNFTSNKFKEMNNKLNETMENQTLMNTIGIGVNYAYGTGKLNKKIDTNKELLTAYYSNFEKELLQAVAEGPTGNAVEITNPGELYRIMLYRQLEKQRTKVIYVPAPMLTYIAFNYSENGIGVSLLDKTKLYASFRAILMFASVMSSIKSSINRTLMTVNIDEADPDPQGTIETILTEYVGLQASGMPLGRLNPMDIIDSLQKSGTQIKVNGGSRFPTTDIELVENKREVSPPDQTFMDKLQEIHYAGLWVNIETITKTNDVDFATSITSSNLFQAKRFQECQKTYIGFLSSFIKKYIYMGGPLYDKIKEKYDEIEGDKITFEELIESILINLPQADVAVIKEQKAIYDDYCSFLEIATEVYISEGMIKDLLKGDNISATIEDIKLAILNMLKRQYLRAQNMLPELDSLLTNSESNVAELLKQHNDSIIKVAGDVLRTTVKTESEDDTKTKEVMDEINPQPEENQEGGESNNYSENGEEGTSEDTGESGDTDITSGSEFNSDNGDDMELSTDTDVSEGTGDEVTESEEEETVQKEIPEETETHTEENEPKPVETVDEENEESSESKIKAKDETNKETEDTKKTKLSGVPLSDTAISDVKEDESTTEEPLEEEKNNGVKIKESKDEIEETEEEPVESEKETKETKEKSEPVEKEEKNESEETTKKTESKTNKTEEPENKDEETGEDKPETPDETEENTEPEELEKELTPEEKQAKHTEDLKKHEEELKKAHEEYHEHQKEVAEEREKEKKEAEEKKEKENKKD